MNHKQTELPPETDIPMIVTPFPEEHFGGETSEIEIYDCRGKELMTISRFGGDLVINFFDEDGEPIFTSWYQLKKPAKRNYEKIIKSFEEIKKRLVQQPP